MSVSVGQRVQSMIDHMSKGEIELALSDICIAVDITAQKYYNEPTSSAACYKRFLKEYMDDYRNWNGGVHYRLNKTSFCA